MEQATGGLSGSSLNVREHDQTAFESIQFNEEIQRIIAPAPENAGSFTALLELPPTQAMELLHSPNCDGAAAAASASGESLNDINNQKCLFHSFNRNLAFPSNTALIERAAMFSVPNEEKSLPEEASLAPLNSRASLNTVKNEPPETDSNPSSTQGLVSNAAIEDESQRAAKRKEREKKVKGSSKKSKRVADETSRDGEKLPYVHVRARRGQATDSHSLAERARREKINARMKLLQELVPGCSKISGTALVLDEIINHVQSLQRQVEFLSVKLAAVNPTVDFDLDSIMATGGACLVDSNFSGTVTPLMWPEVPVDGNKQQYQQQWQSDAFNQPIWGRGEENHNFMTPENSLLSYDSSANSAFLHSNHSKVDM